MGITGMDLGHHRPFNALPATRLGERLLQAAGAELQAGRAEAVDIHLRTGVVVERVVALRLEGGLAMLATRHGQWSHHLAADEVAMVHHLPRGGRRD